MKVKPLVGYKTNFPFLEPVCVDFRQHINPQPCIFILEPDSAVSESLGMLVETMGFVQQIYHSIEQFWETYDQLTPGCLIMDDNLRGMDSLKVHAELVRRNIQLPVIFLTKYGDLPNKAIINAGRYAVLTKPVQIELLLETFQVLLPHETNLSVSGEKDGQ